jgi:hypothetical protein
VDAATLANRSAPSSGGVVDPWRQDDPEDPRAAIDDLTRSRAADFELFRAGEPSVRVPENDVE